MKVSKPRHSGAGDGALGDCYIQMNSASARPLSGQAEAKTGRSAVARSGLGFPGNGMSEQRITSYIDIFEDKFLEGTLNSYVCSLSQQVRLTADSKSLEQLKLYEILDAIERIGQDKEHWRRLLAAMTDVDI